jgi:hypothetical protein
VLVGASLELMKRVGRQEGIRRDGGVVNCGHMDQVKDGIGVLKACLTCRVGSVDDWLKTLVEGHGAIERRHILGAEKVVVAAGDGIATSAAGL